MVVFKSPYPSVPLSNEPFGDKVLGLLWKNAVQHPQKKAFINGENEAISVTFADLYMHSLSVASYLEDRHVGHGDCACIVLPNCWQWVPIFLGCSLQGVCVSGTSPVFTDYELERQFLDSKSKMVFCNEDSLDRVLKAVKHCPLISTIVLVELVPAPHPGQEPTRPFGVHSFVNVLKTPPSRGVRKRDIDVKRDVMILPYSSGTTGSPKGVMLSHQGFGTMLDILQDQVDKFLTKDLDIRFGDESILLMLPFYHIYGFGVLMQTLTQGATGIIMSHFDPDVFFRSIQNYKIKLLMTVPPILVAMAKHPVVAKYDLSSLRLVVSGAAPAGKDICDEVQKRHPNLEHIIQGYGMTEVSMASHLPQLRGYKFGSVGQTMALTETKILEVGTDKELGVGQRGEILVRGPTVMLGYLGRPQATAECIDDEGWLHTGDIGYMDEDGYLFVVDRLKELIKVKGLQVPPAELEDLLLSHPGVRDAAVIGIPDAASGEIPKAFVVKGDPKLTEQQIIEFVKEKVAHYKQLRGGCKFVEEIPKSPAGKILRRLLRDNEAAHRQQQSKL